MERDRTLRPLARAGRVGPRRALRLRRLAPALLVVAVASIALLLPILGSPHAGPAIAPLRAAPHAAASPVPAARAATAVSLGIGSSPPALCGYEFPNCPVGTTQGTVEMDAQAGIAGHNAWPAVQMLFLVETTPYDGVYDPSAEVPGSDPCGDAAFGTGPLCDESNGVPFFVENAGPVAEALQAANPETQMSFGMVDYFATRDAWDGGGGTQFHVDVGRFVNASQFGRSVGESFQRSVLGGGFILPHSDLAQNFLDSDSITALYAALSGWNGVNWTSSTHHVLVQIGSTAPRDPNYAEDYCVSPAVTPHGLTNCTAPVCEPATTLGRNMTPACFGWVLSSSGSSADTIAALAHQGAACADSVGGNCTIDEIDLNDTSTNPTSPSWSAAGGSGGPANWTADASAILQAGCDMASSTGGSWDGPSWFTCRSLGTTGDLAYVPPVSSADPNANNPTLEAALLGVGLGTVPNPVVASGAGRPMFEFFPYGNFATAPLPDFHVSCANASGGSQGCPSLPTYLDQGGFLGFGWNWSDSPTENVMHLGDRWSLTFSVVDLPPPYGNLPVDACVTVSCLAAGSGAVPQGYTAMVYYLYGSQSLVIQSFNVTVIDLIPPVFAALPAGAAPPIVSTPTATTTAPPSLPTLPPTPAPPIPAAVVPSLQPAAAGIIAAGFIRLGVRSAPQEVTQASLSGAMDKRKGRKRRRGGPSRIPLHWG